MKNRKLYWVKLLFIYIITMIIIVSLIKYLFPNLYVYENNTFEIYNFLTIFLAAFISSLITMFFDRKNEKVLFKKTITKS
jgi:uncharacterized membrane protein